MAVLFASVLLGAPSVRADIYRFVDKDGVEHFSNQKLDSRYQLYIREGMNKRRPARHTVRGETRALRPHGGYDYYIREASAIHGLDENLIKAMIRVESNFDASAVSHKGAKGLMQIMPENYPRLGITDPFDPRQSILGGASYLRSMIDRFDGNLRLALAAYNAGPTTVARYRSIPPIRETEEYVAKVINHYFEYRKAARQRHLLEGSYRVVR